MRPETHQIQQIRAAEAGLFELEFPGLGYILCYKA